MALSDNTKDAKEQVVDKNEDSAKKTSIIEKIKKFADLIGKFTDQGNFEYDFGYDVAQKITFVLTLLVLWVVPDIAGFDFALFIFCCIIGRIVVMSILQTKINDFIKSRGGRRSNKRFLNMPHNIWKLIVFVIVTIITVKDIIQPRSLEDFLITLPGWIVMYICGFFIFGGITGLTPLPDDPERVGSPAWKKANGVEKVNLDLMNPLYRDKNGNYYRGTGFVPVPPPVYVINKKK